MERTIELTKNKKGQMRVIETILAALVIVAALSFTNIFAVVPTSPKYEPNELQKLGYNVLHDLDMEGLLARYVYTQQWDNVKASLRVVLPLDVYFNVTIYSLSGARLNDVEIFYGDRGSFSASTSMGSVTYGLAGYPTKINGTCYQATCDPRILVLQLVRG